MMMSSVGITSCDLKAQRFLHGHPSIAMALPEPGTVWEFADHEEITHRAVHILSKANAIKRAGVRRPGGNEAGKIIQWETTQDAHAFIRDEIADRQLTPCGHSGVRCLEAGEVYSCGRDDCDETFGREAAKEVLEG